MSGHKNGYVKLKIQGKSARQEFYVQQLAAIASGFVNLGDVCGHSGTHECSHLCHEPTCFNPEHIHVEPAAVNKSRNFCVQLTCACGHVLSNCAHVPRCIL